MDESPNILLPAVHRSANSWIIAKTYPRGESELTFSWGLRDNTVLPRGGIPPLGSPREPRGGRSGRAALSWASRSDCSSGKPTEVCDVRRQRKRAPPRYFCDRHLGAGSARRVSCQGRPIAAAAPGNGPGFGQEPGGRSLVQSTAKHGYAVRRLRTLAFSDLAALVREAIDAEPYRIGPRMSKLRRLLGLCAHPWG
jgi:hypothetical protein